MLRKSSAVSSSVLIILAGCSSGQSAVPPEQAASRAATATHAFTGGEAPGPRRAYVAASVVASPGARCQLHPEGSTDTSQSIPVSADYDGVARFQAVRATPTDAIRRLALDCTSAKGTTSTYPVDLQSEVTFAPHPLDLTGAPGAERPALAGDPLGYSQADLIQRGYGLRPDPQTHPQTYAHWLASASRPARLLGEAPPASTTIPELVQPEAPELTPEVTRTAASPNWTGAVLTGAPTYTMATAWFVVPTAIPGGDGTGNTQVAIWAGLGGYGTAGGLIQGGIWVNTSSSALSMFSFTEYCCGDSPKGETWTKFTPNAGDTIFVQEWYCDPNGNPNTNVNAKGGYGCSYVFDETSGAVVACNQATGAACTSVPPLYQANWVIGNSADFVMELTPYPSWPEFSGPLEMTGDATTSTGAMEMIGTDPSVVLLEDFTAPANPTHVAVTFPSTSIDEVEWVTSRGGPDMLWWNAGTGALSAWETNNGTVTGALALSSQCSEASGCANAWSPIDAQANSVLWTDPTTGTVSAWTFDASGNVTIDPSLSWTCNSASGCSSTWRPIGRVTEGKQSGLLWYGASSGQLGIWDLTGSTVTGTQTLSWTCGAGCSSAWHAILTADINNDGNTDVLWYNEATGVVSAWLLNGATVTGTQNLSWTCTAASGCASTWHIVGAADVNGDGHTDVTWYDPTNGQLSSWLLNGSGGVTGTQTASWTCTMASGCASAWRPIGYVSLP